MFVEYEKPACTYHNFKQYLAGGVLRFGSVDSGMKTWGITSRYGSNNPGHVYQIAHHMDASTDYYRRDDTVSSALINSSSHGSYYIGNHGYVPTLLWPNDYTSGTPTRADLIDCRERALKSIKRKLANKSGKYSSLVPLAEIKDMRTTYTSMCNLTSDMLLGIVNAKRRFMKNPKRAIANITEFASNAWLTYSFGIAPAVSDFENLAESVTWRLSRIHNIKEVGGSSITFNDAPFSQSLWVCGPGDTSNDTTVRFDVSFQYTLLNLFHAGRYIDLDIGDKTVAIQSQFGLKWSELIPAGYELIPYSWLLDYFTSAGDFVNDSFTTPAGNTVYNNETKVLDYTASVKATIVPGSLAWGSQASIVLPAFSGKIIRRVRLSQLPHADLRFKSLDEISNNAFNRLLNLGALASPILTRKLR